MSKFEFDGEIYNDDRMFVLYVCKCKARENDEFIATTLYHEEIPEDCMWCVVTFRNVERYFAYRVDYFYTEREAIAYSASVEPTTPLVSLGGKAPKPAPTYEEFIKWKKRNNCQEYDYKKMFSPSVTSPRETIYQEKSRHINLKK